jgi:hypothetical protein
MILKIDFYDIYNIWIKKMNNQNKNIQEPTIDIQFLIPKNFIYEMNNIIYEQNTELLHLIINEYNLDSNEVFTEFNNEVYCELPLNKKIRFK